MRVERVAAWLAVAGLGALIAGGLALIAPTSADRVSEADSTPIEVFGGNDTMGMPVTTQRDLLPSVDPIPPIDPRPAPGAGGTASPGPGSEPVGDMEPSEEASAKSLEDLQSRLTAKNLVDLAKHDRLGALAGHVQSYVEGVMDPAEVLGYYAEVLESAWVVSGSLKVGRSGSMVASWAYQPDVGTLSAVRAIVRPGEASEDRTVILSSNLVASDLPATGMGMGTPVLEILLNKVGKEVNGCVSLRVRPGSNDPYDKERVDILSLGGFFGRPVSFAVDSSTGTYVCKSLDDSSQMMTRHGVESVWSILDTAERLTGGG